MVEWFVAHPWITGVATFFLMWSDWLLTILQERERQLHYAEHYQSYPVNTIEGSPLYQSLVKARRIAEPRHIIPALILGALVAYALVWIPRNFQVAFIGYVWGLFLIVDTTHLGNIIGYRAGRRGLHGKQFLHLRTGYLIQMGRYLALAAFLSLLAVCSASPFIVGVAIAGVTSAVRQLLWLRRIPAIDAADEPPVTWIQQSDSPPRPKVVLRPKRLPSSLFCHRRGRTRRPWAAAVTGAFFVLRKSNVPAASVGKMAANSTKGE